MISRIATVLMLFASSGVCLAHSNGEWLKKVPQPDHERVNPCAGQPEAIAAGRLLFADHCAKCHGEEAQGKGSRPSLRSEHIREATDGDLAWILRNGQVFRGMPRWAALPEQQRWQIITYIRSLNSARAEVSR